ncbi:MAG: DNA polymerase I, partial [Calditrichaeota bacterium]|nr:DNA polymerase I [Calditrichota bacterium]
MPRPKGAAIRSQGGSEIGTSILYSAFYILHTMKLFLFDGSALVHRSFHAFSNRSGLSTRGQEVGMVFGFLTTLLMVLRRERPDRLALAFDTGAPTFRHIRFEEYKATRGPLDEGIRSQLPILHDLLALLNIPQLSLDGYEADDIIGTLAVQGAAAGNDVFIVAGDKDFLQLVNDRIRVYRLPNSRVTDVPEIIDSVGVINRFGVPPERVIDVLGLMGDSVDNVPGVPKVGEKTALELVRRFGSLEGALERAAEVERPALRENLIAYADQARLSKELVIIETAVPLGVEPDALRIGPMHTAASRKRLIELEFHNLLRQIEALEPTLADEGLFQEEVSADNTTDEKPPANYRAVTSPGQFSEMIAALRGATLVSLDTETTAIDPMKAELVGLSFSIRPEEAWYVSVNHFTGVPEDYRPSTPAPTLRPRRSRELAYILEHLIPFFGDSGIAKTGQNLKYDTLVLKCYNIEVEGLAFDAMLASFVLDPSARQHGIDALAESHLNFRKIPTSDLIGSGTKQKSMLDVPLDAITRYACEDADIALRLTHHFQPRLKSESLDRLYYETELVLMPVLMRMEFTGLQIDTALLGQLSREFQVEMDERLAEVHDLAGMTFNLNSTQQLAQVLYERLGLPVGRKTKFGWSTDVEELERLAPLHPLPAKLLRYRHLTKLKSTYIDALPQMVHPITGRVHTSFSQTTAATGRLASTDPNLQNIPIRTDEGGRIRKAFVAGIPGWKIVSADYSQVELRIMAHLAGDERMIEAFRSGKDIHRATAAW